MKLKLTPVFSPFCTENYFFKNIIKIIIKLCYHLNFRSHAKSYVCLYKSVLLFFKWFIISFHLFEAYNQNLRSRTIIVWDFAFFSHFCFLSFFLPFVYANYFLCFIEPYKDYYQINVHVLHIHSHCPHQWTMHCLLQPTTVPSCTRDGTRNLSLFFWFVCLFVCLFFFV